MQQEGIGDRLRQSVERWHEARSRELIGAARLGGGANAFAAALREAGYGGAGASRQTLARYFSNEVVPAADFCVVAAKLLGVDLVWLLTGEGQSTRADSSLAGRTRSAVRRAPDLARVAVAHHFAGISAQDAHGPAAVATILADSLGGQSDAWRVRLRHPDAAGALAALLVKALKAPLAVLGIEAEGLSRTPTNAYLSGLAQALTAALLPNAGEAPDGWVLSEPEWTEALSRPWMYAGEEPQPATGEVTWNRLPNGAGRVVDCTCAVHRDIGYCLHAEVLRAAILTDGKLGPVFFRGELAELDGEARLHCDCDEFSRHGTCEHADVVARMLKDGPPAPASHPREVTNAET